MNSRTSTRFFHSVVAVAILAAPTAGQSYRSAAALTVGGSVNGDLAPGLPLTTRFKPGWVAGIQYEYWFGSGRTGLRVNTLFTQREIDSTPYGDYNVFAGDVDLLVRLLPPDPSRMTSPFLSVGAGGTHYGAVAGSGPLAQGIYGDHPVRAHLLTSLGVDIATSSPVAVRAEVGDKIVFPSIGYSPSYSGFPNVHNLVATVALQVRMGSLEPEVRGRPVEPAPAVAPAPEEAPDTETREALAELESRMAEWRQETARLRLRVQALQDQLAAAQAPPVEGTLFTVQVGSFLEPERAERLVAELRRIGIPVWRWDAVADGMTFSRVRAGAVSSRAEAERLAVLLQRERGLPVWVDAIEAEEGMPAGAVSATRSFLDRSGG